MVPALHPIGSGMCCGSGGDSIGVGWLVTDIDDIDGITDDAAYEEVTIGSREVREEGGEEAVVVVVVVAEAMALLTNGCDTNASNDKRFSGSSMSDCLIKDTHSTE